MLSKNIMKMRVLVLVGILAIGLPMVLLAQTVSTTTTTDTTIPPIVGGCMVVSPGNSEIEMLTNRLTCVYNIVNDLSNKVNSLEKRLSALESKTIVGPAVPTNNACPIGQVCGTTTSTGVCPVDSICGTTVNVSGNGVDVNDIKAIQQFLNIKSDGIFGPITKEAVKNFQGKQNLTITGYINNDTLLKMQILVPTNASMQHVKVPQE